MGKIRISNSGQNLQYSYPMCKNFFSVLFSSSLGVANGANKKLALHVQLRCGSLTITTPVSLLANELNVRSVLHRHVSVAALNQIYVNHEAMNGCKMLTIH